MKAMIMAAGLGTRLRPWTLEHPKALVPVGGVPMLERVIVRLRDEGFDYIVVNVHHFADQIVDFLASRDFGVEVRISDESGLLLDTGGAIVKAASMLIERDDEPFLVHNVDILSNAPLRQLIERQKQSERGILLLTSGRNSTRKLVFNPAGELCGWHRIDNAQFRPDGFRPAPSDSEEAFSGIYVFDSDALRSLCDYSRRIGKEAFPIMDYFMEMAKSAGVAKGAAHGSDLPEVSIGRYFLEDLRLIDIGRPETLNEARTLFAPPRV